MATSPPPPTSLPVPETILSTSTAAAAAASEDEEQARHANELAEAKSVVMKFALEPLGLIQEADSSISGMRMRLDLPNVETAIEKSIAHSIGLEFVREFNLLVLPTGLPSDANRGVQLINPNAGGAVILVIHTWLNQVGQKTKAGVNVSGMYVVDRVHMGREGKKEAVWKAVTPPMEWGNNQLTRMERFYHYIQAAMAAAVCEEWKSIYRADAGTDDMMSQTQDVDGVMMTFDGPAF